MCSLADQRIGTDCGVMNLRDRLRDLKPEAKPQAPRVYHDPPPLEYLQPLETSEGATYYLDKVFIEYHGQIDFKNFPLLNPDTLRFLSLDRKLRDFSLEDFAFLDIETTGA